jgi:hypothetical protein
MLLGYLKLGRRGEIIVRLIEIGIKNNKVR